MNKYILVVIISLFMSSLHATDVQILHQEAVDGDMDFVNFPYFNTLEVGQYLIEGSMTYGPSSGTTAIIPIDLDAFAFNTDSWVDVDVHINANISIQMPQNRLDQISFVELFWQGNTLTDTQEVFWGLEALDVDVERLMTFHDNTYYFFQADTRPPGYTGPALEPGEEINLNYSILIEVKNSPPAPIPALMPIGLSILASLMLLTLIIRRHLRLS